MTGCTCPLDAWPAAPPAKGIVFSPTKSYRGARPFSVPCGQCMGCRLAKAQDWATRIHHESMLHECNSFITLTYSDHHLPRNGSISVRACQLFIKRLRKEVEVPIRYYLCGEYGTTTFRPHYHAIIFGYDFPDKELLKRGKNGDLLFRSATLERAWPFGNSSIGRVNPTTAAYVARYVTKKANSELAALDYRVTDPETGLTWELEREFALMSMKPGLGYGWFEKYGQEAFPSDFVIVEGKKVPVPEYYSRLLEKRDPEAFRALKLQRRREANEEHIKQNNTEARRMTRHEYDAVAVSRKERDFE